MNWKKIAIEDLNDYPRKKEALISMSERLQALKLSADGLKAVAADKVPIQGGSSVMGDSIINNIAERDRLKRNYQITLKLVQCIERGLAVLNEEEKTVLDKFYIHRTSRHVDDLCQILNYSKTRIYQIRDEALEKFTQAEYGVVQE